MEITHQQAKREAAMDSVGTETVRRLGSWRMLVAVVMVFAASAFGAASAMADAPNPINGTITGEAVINPGGSVTVYVRGEWNWLSHKSDCNQDRAGAGLGVVWNDPSEPGYTLSKNGITASVGVSSLRPGDTANVIDGQVHPADRGNVPQGFTAPPGYPAGQQFVDPAPVAAGAAHPYTQWKGGCGREPLTGAAAKQFEGRPWGSWGYEKQSVGSDGKV